MTARAGHPSRTRTVARMSTTAADLTRTVLARHENVPDARLRQIIRSLITHLHAFATEVGLTQDEWNAGIEFLTATGHITDENRQEFILLSDTLGLSMLVDLIDHRSDHGETESTVLGPFWVADAPRRESGAVIARAEDGEPLHVSVRVLGPDGAAVEGAVVDTWQASAKGLYDGQDPLQPKGNLRGRFRTDADGRVEFWTVRPAPYPIPDDGPVGRMLASLGRHPWRAAHIHFRIWADAYQPLTTHLFDSASDFLDSDTVFGVKDSLIRTFDLVGGTPPAELAPGATQHYRLTSDFVLAGRCTSSG